MPRDFIPSTDGGLLDWATNFDTLVSAAPTDYGLTIEQATAYSAARTAYHMAYELANQPTTRTPIAIEDKNAARADLIAISRTYVRIAQASPVMTNGKRVALGITVPDVEPTPVPVPSESPVMEVASVDGWTVKVHLKEAGSTSRARPAGVAGAFVWTFVGDAPPTSLGAWKFEGTSTRTLATIQFADTIAPGSRVWMTAAWVNGKLQTGPACTPVSTRLNYGGLAAQAA